MGYTHEYRREYGNIAFYAGSFTPELQFRTNTVAVLYDQDGGTMLKHGEPDKVRQWLKKYEGTLPAEMVRLVVVEFPADYPVSDLNAMINTSGSAPFHVDRASKGDYKPE